MVVELCQEEVYGEESLISLPLPRMLEVWTYEMVVMRRVHGERLGYAEAENGREWGAAARTKELAMERAKPT